jgi:opacity protein-like surface antigen
MRKALIVAAFLLIATQSAYAAPDRTAKWDIGLNVSGAIPDEGDSAVYVGGTAAYGVNNWLAIGIESGWAQFDDSDAGVTVESDMVPLFGDIILRVPMENQVQPYAIFGLGAIFWDASTDVANVEVDVDTAFAAKFGAGLDWFINENWIANFEFSYVTSDAEGTARNTVTGASISAEGETDYWMVGGGIKYLFS